VDPAVRHLLRNLGEPSALEKNALAAGFLRARGLDASDRAAREGNDVRDFDAWLRLARIYVDESFDADVDVFLWSPPFAQEPRHEAPFELLAKACGIPRSLMSVSCDARDAMRGRTLC
jgi:hypothetical protein